MSLYVKVVVENELIVRAVEVGGTVPFLLAAWEFSALHVRIDEPLVDLFLSISTLLA